MWPLLPGLVPHLVAYSGPKWKCQAHQESQANIAACSWPITIWKNLEGALKILHAKIYIFIK